MPDVVQSVAPVQDLTIVPGLAAKIMKEFWRIINTPINDSGAFDSRWLLARDKRTLAEGLQASILGTEANNLSEIINGVSPEIFRDAILQFSRDLAKPVEAPNGTERPKRVIDMPRARIGAGIMINMLAILSRSPEVEVDLTELAIDIEKIRHPDQFKSIYCLGLGLPAGKTILISGEREQLGILAPENIKIKGDEVTPSQTEELVISHLPKLEESLYQNSEISSGFLSLNPWEDLKKIPEAERVTASITIEQLAHELHKAFEDDKFFSIEDRATITQCLKLATKNEDIESTRNDIIGRIGGLCRVKTELPPIIGPQIAVDMFAQEFVVAEKIGERFHSLRMETNEKGETLFSSMRKGKDLIVERFDQEAENLLSNLSPGLRAAAVRIFIEGGFRALRDGENKAEAQKALGLFLSSLLKQGLKEFEGKEYHLNMDYFSRFDIRVTDIGLGLNDLLKAREEAGRPVKIMVSCQILDLFQVSSTVKSVEIARGRLQISAKMR